MKEALRPDNLGDPSVIMSVTSETEMLAEFGHVTVRQVSIT